MWKNFLQSERENILIQRMDIACWSDNARITPAEYVENTRFPHL